MANYPENYDVVVKQKQIFNQLLSKCLRDYPQTRNRPSPACVERGKSVDFFHLATRVRDLGGYDAVTEHRLWPSIAVEVAGLDSSGGPALKLVFAKYLKLVEQWMQRKRKRSRGSMPGGRGQIVEAELATKGLEIVVIEEDDNVEEKKMRRSNDVVADTVARIRGLARNPGAELRGPWMEECVSRAKIVRQVLFFNMKAHHPQQPLPSTHIHSFLPGVLPLSIMAASIQTDEDNQQISQEGPRICNVTSGCKFNFKEHIRRKRVRIGSEFQAEIPSWNSPLQKSITHIGNADTSFCKGINNSRWIFTPIWPMKDCESVVNKERIGKGRTNACSCAVKGSVECVRLHVEEERKTLKEELGDAFFAWSFEDMGETVSEKWSLEEERKFGAMVRLNPASLEKNFWKHLPTCFPSKKIESLVSYYFNVFVLRRRGIQNRAVIHNIDSDDDESEMVSSDDVNLQAQKHKGSNSNVKMPNMDRSGRKSGSQASCINAPNFCIKFSPTKGREGVSVLPHVEGQNCIDVLKQDGMASLSYSGISGQVS